MNVYSFQKRLIAIPLSLTLWLAGCGSSGSSANTANPNAGNFTRTVFLGDSLTAGYQSGSLQDLSQVNGWAAVVAKQAGFNMTLPLVGAPGVPSVLELLHYGPPPTIVNASGTSAGRDNPSVQATDLAVPGALVYDVANTVPVAAPTTGQQYITQLVLGYPGLSNGQALTQAQFAINANPTTIFLWIGSNDALNADFSGMPSSCTPLATFTTQYQALIALLTTKTTAHLVIGNIPDVTAVPYMQPAAYILSLYSAGTGLPVSTLGTLFGVSTGDLINQEGLGEISAILAGTQATPISDAGVLTVAEQATVKATVASYNQVIAAAAASANATLVDINSLFASITANGVAAGGVTGTTSFLGGMFSLDGIHPTNTGYATLANKFIDTMNASIGTAIPDANLTAIAATDPLWPPNISHMGSVTRFPMTMPSIPGIDDLYLPAIQRQQSSLVTR